MAPFCLIVYKSPAKTSDKSDLGSRYINIDSMFLVKNENLKLKVDS